MSLSFARTTTLILTLNIARAHTRHYNAPPSDRITLSLTLTLTRMITVKSTLAVFLLILLFRIRFI